MRIIELDDSFASRTVFHISSRKDPYIGKLETFVSKTSKLREENSVTSTIINSFISSPNPTPQHQSESESLSKLRFAITTHISALLQAFYAGSRATLITSHA